jgi:hypothetical protein
MISSWIAGLGCVTPLGSSPAEVWQRLAAGEKAPATEVTNPETGRRHLAALVPPAATAHLAREPRLRRSSAISLLAAAAGQSALAASGLTLTDAVKSRLAVVFGVSSGGVQYTRRFYEQVVKQGANAASPMLFPETVYNAPASHLAALLGVDGATYTLVGDGSVGLQALHFGAQLLALGDADHVLVVAAEELDWILLEAHRDWRLTTDGKNPGALLAEAAAAVLLTRDPTDLRVHTTPGHPFTSRQEAPAALDTVLRSLQSHAPVDLTISGANHTWIDPILTAALAHHFPTPQPALTPKLQLGEALGATALLQVLLAAAALKAPAPATKNSPAPFSEKSPSSRRAVIATLGWNQHASGAIVEQF